jgi:hypothetical protein
MIREHLFFFFFETANFIHVEKLQRATNLADRRPITKGAAYIRYTKDEKNPKSGNNNR